MPQPPPRTAVFQDDPAPGGRLHWPGALFILAVAALSLSLNNARDLLMLTYAAADDQLFIRLGESLCRGEWLGPYDLLTLSKGPGYPAFLCASSLLGLPLRVAQQGLWLLAGFFAARTLARIGGRPALLPVLFPLFALCPLLWGADFRTIIRDNLYFTLCLALLTAAIAAFDPACRSLRRRLPALCLLGMLFAACYLTREEDVWLYPSLAALALWRLFAGLPAGDHRLRWLAGEGTGMAAAAAAALLVIAPVWLMNKAHYGVLRDNDFRASAFPAAYGALARINHDHWRRYVVWPKDARERAYAVSPAARELAPYFEGPEARQEMWEGWDELTGPQFIWSLRKGAAAAGHFSGASEADAYFRRLAREINQACDSGAIPCAPPRRGFMPVFQTRFIVDTLEAIFSPVYRPTYFPEPHSMAGFLYQLIGLRFTGVPDMPQGWDEEMRARFIRMTATVTPLTPPGEQRRRIAGWVYVPDTPITIGIAPAPGAPPATLSSRPAEDVAGILGPAARHAIRFVFEQACETCALQIHSAQAQWDLSVGPAGPGVPAPVRLYIENDRPLPAAALEAPGRAWRQQWIDAITPVYRWLFAGLTAAAAAVCGMEAVRLWRRRGGFTTLHAIALAVLGAIAVRLLLVGYLEVTAIPNIVNYRYIAPAVPCALLLIATAAALVVRRVTTPSMR